MRKIAVIGSNSFSGSDFIDLLLQDPDNEVLGISRSAEKSPLFLPYRRRNSPRFSFRQLDLNSHHDEIISLFDSFGPEYIINFAAQSEVAPSWLHPGQWFQTNAVALAELVHQLKDREYLKRYVHISSPEIYGSCSGIVTESAPYNPSTPYAASKAAADMCLLAYFRQYNFPVVLVRATNVYGAHQQLFKIIPKAVIRIRAGQKIDLHGGGAAIKSYIHIRDVSRGELAAMLHGKSGDIFHLSPDGGISIHNLVSLICNETGVRFTEAVRMAPERPGQDAAYVIDSSRARRELGWRPVVSLEDGLREVIGWIDGNWETISRLEHEYIHAP
ncbi:MAG TPA: GDP-mannose 4,6-dehydratase [Dongiaceae bacterium]|nr:GDP-mannose 4,6-dehydratase [Dongiaceae bacterium]